MRVDHPDRIRTEMPKRILGVIGFPWRAKLLQKVSERVIEFRKSNMLLTLAQMLPQGVEDEERLVRRAFSGL